MINVNIEELIRNDRQQKMAKMNVKKQLGKCQKAVTMINFVKHHNYECQQTVVMISFQK